MGSALVSLAGGGFGDADLRRHLGLREALDGDPDDEAADFAGMADDVANEQINVKRKTVSK